MENLVKQQQQTGETLVNIITNYKKDSANRKNLGYYEERLKRLENSWAVFEETDSKIRALPDLSLDHAYFANDYYKKISEVYSEYSTYFLSRIEEIQGKDKSKTEEKVAEQEKVSSCRPITQSNSQSEEIIRLIRRQKEVARTLNRHMAGIREDISEHSKQYYELKIRNISQNWAQAEDLNQRLWEVTDDPTSEGYDANEYIKLEEGVQESLIFLAERLDKVAASVISSNSIISTDTMMKLPKITLPKFDGNYLQWRQFYDLFNEMVHKQPMADCQKMFYLKANLSGEAERLIKHLSASENNYAAAWEMLQERYDNERLMVNAFIHKLMSQPAVMAENASSIKTLHDKTQECLLGLENLGIPTGQWDPILLYWLVRKLDRNTHSLYEQSLTTPKKVQTIKGFLSFLEARFQSLEALGAKGKYQEYQYHKQPTSRPITSGITTTSNCIACKGDHPLYLCKNFTRLTPEKRLNLVKRNNYCINCLKPGHALAKCTLRACFKCGKKHNSLLHVDNQSTTTQSPPRAPHSKSMTSPSTSSYEQPSSLAAQTVINDRGYVLLSTAIVTLINKEGKRIDCRAILDSGSQVNFISEGIVKRLGVTEISDLLLIQGIGQTKQRSQQRVNIELQSRLNGYSTAVEAFVLSQIIAPQPAHEININMWALPKNIKLADPEFNKPGRIDLLLGAEFYHELLSIGQIKLGKGLPILQNTVFGWVLSGKIAGHQLKGATCGVCSEDEEFDMQKFWKLEEVNSVTRTNSPEQERCEALFNQTIKRDSRGKFIVRLPFKQNPEKLGQSKDCAVRRFISLERKFARDPEFKAQYTRFMQEYISLGHMTEIKEETIQQPHYFLPHHGVLKPESTTTKLRVVFDASAKTSTNIALNDVLATGPTIQDDLFSILLRFRLPRFAFTADIEKMYRQVLVDEEDRRYQLIVWRNEINQPLRYYQLNTVTYGTTSASYLATKCLQMLAQIEGKNHQAAAEVLRREFYVDDVMTGCNSLVEACFLQKELMSLLAKGGFRLRKWCANHPKLLQNIPPEDTALQLDFTDNREEQIKTLGLTWIPKTDMFCIKTNWAETKKVTKRIVSSDIARLFDPLGIMAPVVVVAKMFLQELWALKIDWDAALPMEFHTRWEKFRNGLKALHDIKIPRHVFGPRCSSQIQIHAFADASEKAYGGAVYLRSVTQEKQIIVRLLCAKSRVAPIKQTTLPRLELCAALLTAELTKRVKQDLKMEDIATFYWTDSEIVLAWINSTSSSFQTFVANRIASIQELSIPQQWRHVASKQNPADILSRGIAPEKLSECNLWFYGPPFLHGQEEIWPQPHKIETHIDIEKKRTAIAASSNVEHSRFIYTINHKNTFSRLQRIIAYVLRFINMIKNRKREHARDEVSLSSQELNSALHVIIKTVQSEEFEEDIIQLGKYNEVRKTSPLISLAPFIDEVGLVRVGGRLEAASLSYEAKHPILLPYGHQFTKLIMSDLHVKNRHVGPQGLLAITRQRFWPLKGKTIARSIVQHCIQCNRSKPKMLSQIMGNLPAHRVQPARPFINSGVDFWGPIWTHYRLRGKRPQKSYIAVFCCFATKAVHLEVVTDLSTDAFIGALKRFLGRRGNCKNLYCDNATNFVGARNQLQELAEAIFSDKAKGQIKDTCSSKSIDFHFIPPRAPHFGGLWEAAVKSAKHLMQRSLSSASLTYEELETLIIEIEAILNSRPITSMSTNPNDYTALTPGHFLIGEPLTSTVDSNAEHLRISLGKRWKTITQLKQEFWDRWTREYLNELQHRSKWKQTCQDVKPGTIVIIREDNTPVRQWPLGRIVRTFKGDDGRVRVADIRTANSIIRRAVCRLAPLPIDTDESETTISMKTDENTNEGHQDVKCTSTSLITPEPKKHQIASSSTDTGDESPRKRVRYNYGSAITSLLLICLTLPASIGQTIEKKVFDSKPGLYYETIGTTNIISSEWNLVIYYDMRPYWTEWYAINNGTRTLEYICNQIDQKGACRKVVHLFQQLQENTNRQNELISTTNAPQRSKRGALDIVGNVANALFGVLDANYAAEMSNIIDGVRENENHLLTLLKNQTSIIDSTLNIIKREQEDADKRFAEFNQHLNQINLRMQNLTDELYQEKLNRLFYLMAIQISIITRNFQQTQATIIDTLTDTHHGKINPLLLPPPQLARELTVIKAHLPSHLRLPIAQEKLIQLYKTMEIEGAMTENYVIFKLKLPLVNLDNFDLFRIIPIPAVVNNTLVAIQPSTEFLAINLHRDQFYPLNEVQQSSCLRVEKDNYLCYQRQPIYQLGSDNYVCEMELFHQSKISSKCDLRTVRTKSFWIQLYHSNQWIYAVTQRVSVNIVCGNQASQLQLEGSGLIKINDNCVLKNGYLQIQGHNIYPSSSRLSYHRLANISGPIKMERLPQLTYNPALYHVNVADIEKLHEEILSLGTSNLPSNLKHHHIHHYVLGYLSTTAIIILILIGLYWRHKPGPWCRRTANPTAQPSRPAEHSATNILSTPTDSFTVNI